MIGTKLQQLRKSHRWSMQHVAGELGIAKSTYAGYETGYREPSLDTLRKAAALFQVSVDELFSPDEIEGSARRMPDAPDVSALSGGEDASPVQPGDPELEIWFKELIEAPEERRAELKQIWDIIKQRESGRTPGQHQGES